MIRLLVGILVFVINVVYANRPYPRFYVLETVARVPYFSYLSVLHLYETLGWWRKADWLKIHFSESWNELHHLLIMESLGINLLGRSASSKNDRTYLLLDYRSSIYSVVQLCLSFHGTCRRTCL